MAETVLVECVVVYGVGVERHMGIVLLKTVRNNVQPRTQRDVAAGKLMVNHVLMESVVVMVVGVGPHQIIVLVKTVKNNVYYRHLLLHHHLHPDFHDQNVDCKRMVRDVLNPESVVVYGVCVEPHTSIVILNIVRNNVQLHSHQDGADGKLMVDHVLLDNVVVSLVGVGPHQLIALTHNV